MPEHLFDISLRSSPAPQQRITDAITVHYLHSFEQPFCHNPLCLCQVHRQEAVKVFVQLIEGKLLLEQAQPLLAERTV